MANAEKSIDRMTMQEIEEEVLKIYESCAKKVQPPEKLKEAGP